VLRPLRRACRGLAAPAWATVDPATLSAASPAEGMNLCGGSWAKAKRTQDIVDPLNGEVFLKVPNTAMDEIEPYIQRMAAVPRSGLHNPFKNPERYVMLGEVCGAAAREMFKPE
ncbi:FIS1, partial [Symbiodinium necroappetens]